MSAANKEMAEDIADCKLTIENICVACGKGPCTSPCEKWNDFLEKNYLLPK